MVMMIATRSSVTAALQMMMAIDSAVGLAGLIHHSERSVLLGLSVATMGNVVLRWEVACVDQRTISLCPVLSKVQSIWRKNA